MSIIDDISSAVQRGKRKEVKKLVPQALEEGCDPQEILNKGMIDALGIIGDKFSAGEIFVPEMLVAARAMATGTEILKPSLAQEGAEPVGKAVIGTVIADQHDIGKNLVRMMIEGKGFEIDDLGVDVPEAKFVEYLQEHPDCQIICLSALLTTTMPALDTTIKAIEEAGMREGRKIMVGGAPVNQEYADQIGADAYTVDAGAAAAKALELVNELNAA